jgi:hypothetical protein
MSDVVGAAVFGIVWLAPFGFAFLLKPSEEGLFCHSGSYWLPYPLLPSNITLMGSRGFVPPVLYCMHLELLVE